MDLIPKPEQVVSAASNVAHKLLYGHIADLRRMPRTLIDEGPLREVYHYRPAKQVRTSGDPVLLVTPLAAPATCYDLRRGCSLVEHFVQEGRPTYLVEYGEISFRDRNLGIEHWVGEVIPEAVKAVSGHAGGRPVHVVGWSLGGIFAVLVAASQPRLPIASLTIVGSPFDVTQVPLVAPLRPLLNITDGGIVTQLYRALGGAPKPLVRRAFQLSSGTKVLTKPIATLQHLDDTEWLAQIEAVDHFTANMIAYPGRTFGQLYHRMLKANQLRDGVVHHDGMDIDVRTIRLPVLVFAGNTDGIAPINAVRRLVDLLPDASEVRFEIVPGGHLGMLTGRAARASTWVVMDEWIDQHSTAERAAAKQAPGKRTAAGRTATKKATAKKPTAKKPSTKKTSAQKTSARKAAPGSPAQQPGTAPIGSNPERRYGSASSRNLGRRS
ncbi:MAG TPA: alpha/beta fold hydrolase [Marmoricola sp.]|nr:alpha/beta fold hydrolase [Marmoricola sp.]